MVHVKEKTIHGKKYYYLTKNIRLPNGHFKTIQKLLKDKSESPAQYSEVMLNLESNALGDWAVKQYKTDPVFNEVEIRKIEEMKLGYKKILRKLSKKQLKDIFDRFTVNFTYESNAIEGSTLTLKDVAIILFEQVYPKNADLREIYETRNSREVVEFIIKKKVKVTEKDIIKMHKMLVRDMGIQEGYKQFPNFILESNALTTLPESVPKEMTGLILYYEKNKENIHPLQLAAYLHGKIEKIHPFEDGNGRVGRFLINTILASNGYSPLIIRKTQRLAYYKCLHDFDNGYPQNLERFLLRKYKDTYRKFFKIYIKYLK